MFLWFSMMTSNLTLSPWSMGQIRVLNHITKPLYCGTTPSFLFSSNFPLIHHLTVLIYRYPLH